MSERVVIAAEALVSAVVSFVHTPDHGDMPISECRNYVCHCAAEYRKAADLNFCECANGDIGDHLAACSAARTLQVPEDK
jgi:hypothetical protein